MATELTVVTYNIHRGQGIDGRYDLDRIADVIDRTDADVVGLQEVDRGFRPETEFDDQIQRLGDRLGVETAFAEALVRSPDESPHAGRGTYGVALLSRFPISDRVRTALPQETDTEPRVLLETTVTPTDGRPITCCSTHFGLRRPERRKQAATICERLADQDRLVVTGDFNDTPGSDPIRRLTDAFQTGFDAQETAPQPTFPTPYVEPAADSGRYEVSVPERRIDYVFHSDDIDSNGETVQQSLGSDHSLVVSRLTIPNN